MATKGVNPFAKGEDKGKDAGKKLPPWLTKGDDKKKMATGGAVAPAKPAASKPPMTTQEKEMVQEVKDKKAGEAAGKAYDRAMPNPHKYAQGGSVSSRADGIAQRGKTRGRTV